MPLPCCLVRVWSKASIPLWTRWSPLLGYWSRFFSQPFFVAQPFTGKEGRYVAVEDTIKGFEAILGGELDKVSEVAFNNMGTIEEVWQKSKEQA